MKQRDPVAGERRIDGVVVHRVTAIGGDVKATVVVRLDKLNRLIERAENARSGRARAANGAIEVRLERAHPLAGEGRIGLQAYSYPK